MESIDITQVLRATENAVRDYLALVLHKRRESEKSMNMGADSRLLFYTDFGDLPGILEHHWPSLSVDLGNKDVFISSLQELRGLRNVEAHGRGFFPFEKHLILGLCGRIRTTLAVARSKMDHLDEHFPRLESIRDSLGLTRTPQQPSVPRRTLTVGDVIQFTVAAVDPKGEKLTYGYVWSEAPVWFAEESFSLEVQPAQVGRLALLKIGVKTQRTPPGKWFDEFWEYQFSVLPKT